MGEARCVDLTDGLVQQQWLANVFNLGDCAFEVEGFGEDDFEDLLWVGISMCVRRWWGGRWNYRGYFLDVDAVACTAEDEACSHSFCESAGLLFRC